MPTDTLGFIGLGTMGLPMATNLLAAGYRVVGHDLDRDRVATLVERGGEQTESPAVVAERSDIVLLCLADSPDVEHVVLDGPAPLVDGLSPGMTVIDHSTISPIVARTVADRLAAMDVSMLDAPLSGGEEGAIDGTLSIMVGGKEETLTTHRDLLAITGETVTYCGPNGAGQTTKACNQMIVAAQLTAVAEALVFAEMAGANREAVVEAVRGGAAACWVLEHRANVMLEGTFEPGFFAAYQRKDLRIATDAGEAIGAPLPVTSVTRELYERMVETGLGCDDNAGVIQVIEAMAETD